jgi:hypothetical protein
MYREQVIVPAYSNRNMSTVFLNRFKAKYVNNEWGGEYERAGFKDLHYEVQVNIEVRRKDKEGSTPKFSSVILNCRVPTKGGGPNIGGSVLPGPMSTFEQVVAMVHG